MNGKPNSSKIMKSLKQILLFIFAIQFNLVHSQDFENEPIWSENFETLNPNIWNNGSNVHGGLCNINFDSQIIYVKRGTLHLKALEAIKKDGTKYIKQPYINTYTKKHFKYGKLEIKAKIPVGVGVWPAIWLISEKRTEFPRGEIDMLEYIGCWDKYKFQGNIHTAWKDDRRFQYPKYSTNIDITKYHIYTLEWTKEHIILKVDNEIYLEYEKNNPNGWVFDQDYFLVLNVAFGNGWGAKCGIDNAILPCQMKVDWIKYYKIKE